MIKRRRTRMYEPWGFQEENHYISDENLLLNDIDKFFALAEYNKDDKKIHFFNKDDEEKGTIDVTEFSSSIVQSAVYDKETKILTITFENGDVVEINLAELIDETEFGPGFNVDGGIVSIAIDANGEPYISVSDDGVKISGVDAAIEESVNTEKTRAQEAEADINERIDDLAEELQPSINETLERKNQYESAFGKYNISRTGETDADKTILSVGIGTSDEDRKNAFEIRQDGSIYMWIEGDYLKINDLISMLAHETY